LLVSLLASEDHNYIGTELCYHLPAGAAWGARDVVFVHYGNSTEVELLTSRCRHSGKDCCPLGADCESVGRVFDVAAGIHLAVIGQDRSAYLKLRIGCIRALER